MKTSLKSVLALTTLLAILVLGTACQKEEKTHTGVMITDAWVSEIMPATTVTSGYLTIMNHTDKDDVLLEVKSSISKYVEMHEMVEIEGAMRMKRLESIPVAKSGMVTFKTGGKHIMFIETVGKLTVGDKVSVTLVFKNAGDKVVEMEVKSVKDMHHN